MATNTNKRLSRGEKYPIVDKLKPDAKTVKIYADEQGITVAYVYIKHTRGQADYEIVNYQGINWVQ
ncbi:MAG TPA: hypothetical protein PKV73_00925 [Agriterribacter sp.]|nr:hypothetical protein [Agriterribacter sp.]